MATDKDAKVRAFIQRAQAREDKERVRRVARIKRALAGADFFDGELSEIETVVFTAFGRTKLR